MTGIPSWHLGGERWMFHQRDKCWSKQGNCPVCCSTASGRRLTIAGADGVTLGPHRATPKTRDLPANFRMVRNRNSFN